MDMKKRTLALLLSLTLAVCPVIPAAAAETGADVSYSPEISAYAELLHSPDTPKLGSAQFLDSGDVQFSWSAVEGADGYDILRKRSSDEDFSRLEKVPASQTTYLDKNAEKGCIYSVRAYAQSGSEYAYSDYDQLGVTAGFMELTSVKAVGSETNEIQWPAMDGITSYRIYCSEDGADWEEPIGTVAATGKKTYTFTDQDASFEEPCYYKVVAYQGQQAMGSAVSEAVINHYPEEVDLEDVSASGGALVVSWEPMEHVTKYFVYRKISSGSWSKIAVLEGEESSEYRDETVKKAVPYTYTVRAVKVVDDTAYQGAYSAKGVTAYVGTLPSLSKKSKKIYAGDDFTLTVKNNSKAVKWSSANKAIATVNSKGVVKGVKPGTTTINATIAGAKYSCKVTVVSAMTTTKSSELTISRSTTIPLSLKLDGKLYYKIDKGDVIKANFGYWKNHKINLYVTAKKSGTATLTITNSVNKEKLVFKIKVK